MHNIKTMFLVVNLILLYTSVYCTSIKIDLGETYDVLMGKYTSKWFKPCIRNKSPDPWFSNSKYAYYFSRSLFEKYSIEKEQCQTEVKVPKIIHQIWLGGLVPAKYAAWIETWQKYNPDYTIIMWMDHDIQNLNLVNKDLFMRAKNYGEKSDILRLELINMFGGLYIDTDYECLKPFDKFNACNSFYISSVGVGVCGIGVNNALIGASPGHPLIKKMVHSMKAAAHHRTLSERTGPIYFTRTFFENAEHFQKDVVMYPTQYFTPNPQTARADTRAHAIHWFDASWSKPQGLNQKIPHDSTLELGLTPLYFKKKSNNISHTPMSHYDDCAKLLQQLNHRTIVELGACNFMFDSKIDCKDCKYIGITPVKFLALEQRLLHNNHSNRVYWWKNWLTQEIPHCGLLVIGDSLESLPFENCFTLLKKILNSNPEFFIIAHNPSQKNDDTQLGQSRMLNMCQAPFNFPQPNKVITIDKKTYGIWNNYR